VAKQIGLYRPQSETKKALKWGFVPVPGALLFFFIFRTINVKGLLRKSSPLANLQYSRKWALKLMNNYEIDIWQF